MRKLQVFTEVFRSRCTSVFFCEWRSHKRQCGQSLYFVWINHLTYFVLVVVTLFYCASLPEIPSIKNLPIDAPRSPKPILDSCGTWIRTKMSGFRVHYPTIR